MTVARANFGELLEPGLAHVFMNEIDAWETEYTEIFNVSQSKKKFEEDLLIAGLGIMEDKTEGAAVLYDDIAQSYLTQHTHVTYAKAIRITEEMWEDDLYGVMKDLTGALARSAIQRREVNGANTLNNAFSTSITAGGVSLINSAHVLKLGGTQSNALAANVDLTAASLQEAIQVLEDTKDERGLNVALRAKKLIVPTALQWTASELLGSQFKPGTADNEINALMKKGLTMSVNHFLTDSDAWFLLADNHKLMWYDRMPLEFFKGNDFDTGDAKFKARMRFINGASDWRGITGNAGA